VPKSAPKSEPAAGVGDIAARAKSDYEEAEFYREQGLQEEARALYERVLAALPGHADAQRRLGEIAAPSEASPPGPSAEEVESGDFVLDATAGGEVEAGAAEIDASPLPEEPLAAPELIPLARPAARAPEPMPEVARPPRPVSAAKAASAPRVTAAESPGAALGAADFDLAAELSGTFGESAESARAASAAEGEGFAEVFAAFKAGVKREVGDGDHEVHYDLGIAYKEMGLFEDAIGEFRHALGDPARKLGCLHLLAVCAIELGRSADAIAHLSEALAGGALPGEQEAALRLDLGRAYRASGERARARSEYEAVRAVAPGFADVERLLTELEAESAAPLPDSVASTEAFESFDDLIEDGPPAADPTPAAPKLESFDELISDDAASELEPAAPPPEVELSGPPVAGDEAEIELPEEAPAPAPAEAPAAPPVAKPAVAASAAKAVPPPEPPSAPAAPARRKKKISFV
jgi:tetratricopeptide (TPR) repeat protein